MSSQRFSQAKPYNDDPFSGNAAAGILLAFPGGASWSAGRRTIRERLENDSTPLSGHTVVATRRELLQ
jgi:hypothetical protein